MFPALSLVSDSYSGSRAPNGGNGRSSRAGNGAEHKTTILVVEDEILIRMTAADHLRKAGYRVLEASNAIEALSIFAAGEPIELVFTDTDMPGKMTGEALAQWIVVHFPAVKVLLTSAEAHTPGSPPSGPVPVLKKPYTHAALATHVARLLTR
ncbi:MAG: response regulator [Rhodospirillaceae bacterium]|nr:response regulator [Rhodospirillaceae bacterium]